MKNYNVELNQSDIGILTDILIEQSKKCESITTAEWVLELIEKIQKPITPRWKLQTIDFGDYKKTSIVRI